MRRQYFATAVGILLAVLGLPLLLGGVWLVAVGGSFYYVIAGVALLACAVSLVGRRRTGVWLYAAFLALTIAWSLWEVGFDFWPLVPRLALPLALAILVVLCVPSLNPQDTSPGARAAYTVAGVLGVLLVAMGVVALLPRHLIGPGVQSAMTYPAKHSNTDSEWRHYGRTTAGTRFSPLDEINPSNVHQLKVAWTYQISDLPLPPLSGYESTPLQVGNHLYLCTYRNEVIALDAQSGKQVWRFDPRTASTTWQRCRGVGYHESRDASASPGDICQRRVIASTIDARLFAFDAETGRHCPDFGVHGVVDLKVGMGEVKPDSYFQTAAPLVARDLIIIGGLVRDWRYKDPMPSGVIRAFSAKTGELVWAWDLGNPAITGMPPEGQAYTRGTPNMWTMASFDDQLGLVYVPLGVATGENDLFGAWRSKEDERYSNSVVALDIVTGRPRWHFQTVHHDVWDYDLPPQPTLYDIPDGKGGSIPALIQATKRGQIFLLDRRNGMPIAPVVEKPVPQGGRPDDWLSPTQPYSVGMPSIGTEPLSEARMWGITPFDQLWCRIQFKQQRYEGEFTPPTTKLTLMYPGFLGGMNWGGVAVDESRGYLIVNDLRIPVQMRLLPVGNFLSPLGIPCNQPPWGTLTAIDLASRQIVWQVPMGTTRDTGPLGLKAWLPFPIGLPTLSGSLSTQSGLVFFAGTQDNYLRALDVHTGVELWKARLPVGAQATPMTYVAPKGGRQFVVVVAGGVALARATGAYVIAYALPRARG